MDDDDKEYLFRWGLPLNELYSIALKFYKEKEGNVIQFSYGEKLKLVAYIRQITHGKYNEDVLSPLGVLDVIGRDRRLAWQSLGEMKPRDAMAAFIQLIDKSCLHFKTFVQAQKAEIEEQKKIAEEKKKMEIEMQQRLKMQEEENQNKDKTKYPEENPRKRHIQEALNAQTFHQFKTYAEQQYPGNPEEQAVLVRQLQDQHYHQYMLQLKQRQQEKKEKNEENTKQRNELLNGENVKCEDYHQCNSQIKQQQNSENKCEQNGGTGILVDNNKHCHHCTLQQIKHEKDPLHKTPLQRLLQHQQNGYEQFQLNDGIKENFGAEANEMNLLINPDTVSHVVNNENSDSEESEGGFPISQSYMWTRRDIDYFKDDVKNDGCENIIKVCHGEIVTIRVPTREDGNYLYWEFATDNYDIGFGIYFEWGKSKTNEVSIHISESEEDSDDLLDDEQDNSDADTEQSHVSRPSNRTPKSPTSIIVPIYRRDCHQEVYFGYHKYPAEGVYLLKFDNSYSLWRSKTLYYRIYYTNHGP